MRFTITMTGTTPLLMHNGRLADPLDPAARALKKVTSKRNKTDDDHLAVSEAEFMGALYIDPHVGPYLPGLNIEVALWQGAKMNKLGEKVRRGLMITSDVNPLAYNGPRDAVSLWESEQFTHRAAVVVSRARVMRTRPIFREWAVQADGILDESQLDLDQLHQIASNAGSFVGIGDWLPRFGRFTAKVEEV